MPPCGRLDGPGQSQILVLIALLELGEATVGTACWFVHCTSSRLLLARLMMPPAANEAGNDQGGNTDH